jgi:hypothetical protein
VLWSASLYAQSLPAFQEGSHFVVNILAHHQTELSNKFARTHYNKFAEIDHIIPECGAPVLIGTAPHFGPQRISTLRRRPSRHCCSAAANTCWASRWPRPEEFDRYLAITAPAGQMTMTPPVTQPNI